MTIEIMNLRKVKPTEPWDVRVDRVSPLGNPFYLCVDNEWDRNEVCDKYQRWFDDQLAKGGTTSFHQELNHLACIYEAYGKLRLFCWCAPKRCHAETIKAYL